MSPGLHRYIEECSADDAIERALDHVTEQFDAMFRGVEIENSILDFYREDDLF